MNANQSEKLHTGFPQALFVARSSNVENGRIEGYGSIYDGLPDNGGRIMAHGVFAESLAAHKAAGTMPAMLWAHDGKHPIGRWTEVSEDRRGLKVAGLINLESERGREAFSHLKARDVTGLSIGWCPEQASDFKRNEDGTVLWKKARLLEISVVTVPARKNAVITKVASVESQRSFERLLHTAGFSRAAASRLAAGGWPALSNNLKSEPDEKKQVASLIERINAATCALQQKGSSK